MRRGVKKVVYKLLEEKPELHPTAKGIYDIVKEQIPGVAFSSVYRAINSLVDEEKIRAFKLECEDEKRFEIAKKSHPHMKCTVCGKIYDIDLELHDAFREIAEIHTEHIITGVQVTYYGICKECFKKRLKEIVRNHNV